MMKIKSFFYKNKTILVLCFLIISISLFLLLTMRPDTDYFWHIKAGEYMFKNGILRKDIFSWSLNGTYWMSHEWLFEVIIYVFKLLFGKFHLLIYGFICLVMLLMFLFLANRDNYLKNIPFTLFWLLLSLILVVYLQGRPHLISFVFLALTIWFLYDLYCNSYSKKIYLLPIITLFWANIHGGSSNLSYLFCLIFLIFGLFSFKFSKIEAIRINKRQALKYLLVMFLCIGSICINPHGAKMLFYPYANMLDTVMLNNISEWQPTNLNNPQHYLYFFLLLVVLFRFIFSKKKILFLDFILFGVSVYLGLKSIRFWGYTYIIMSFVVFNYIDKRQYDRGTNLLIFLLSLLLIFMFIFNSKIISKNLSWHNLDEEVIDIIKSSDSKKLYNFYDYGGELIYNDVLVFIDGRADLYSNYNYQDYLNISLLQGDYIKLLGKYDFDLFLVNTKYPINTYLKYDDNYEVLYSKKNIVLYKKID